MREWLEIDVCNIHLFLWFLISDKSWSLTIWPLSNSRYNYCVIHQWLIYECLRIFVKNHLQSLKKQIFLPSDRRSRRIKYKWFFCTLDSRDDWHFLKLEDTTEYASPHITRTAVVVCNTRPETNSIKYLTRSWFEEFTTSNGVGI